MGKFDVSDENEFYFYRFTEDDDIYLRLSQTGQKSEPIELNMKFQNSYLIRLGFVAKNEYF